MVIHAKSDQNVTLTLTHRNQAVSDSLEMVPFLITYSCANQQAIDIDTARIKLECDDKCLIEKNMHFDKSEGLRRNQLVTDFYEEKRDLIFHPDQYVPKENHGKIYPVMLLRMDRAFKCIAIKQQGSSMVVASRDISTCSI